MPPLTRRPKPLLEADVQDAIRAALDKQGFVRVFRNAQATRLLPGGGMVRAGLGPGTPDLIGWVKVGPRKGHVFGLEVKKPGEKPSDGQRKSLRQISDEGGYGCWADNVADALEHARRAHAGEGAPPI